jgi:molybdopterin-containing oxidoreductase family membrane subunit
VFFFAGTFGLFFFLFLLFVRFFPVIAIAEVKSVMPQANPHWEGYGHLAPGHSGGGEGEKSHGHGESPAPAGGVVPSPAVASTGGGHS